jgi:hypothetical protein
MFSILDTQPLSVNVIPTIFFGHTKIAYYLMYAFLPLSILGAIYITKTLTLKLIDFCQKLNYRVLTPVLFILLVIVTYIIYLPLAMAAHFYWGSSGQDTIPDLFWPVCEVIYFPFFKLCGLTGFYAFPVILDIFWFYCVIGFCASFLDDNKLKSGANDKQAESFFGISSFLSQLSGKFKVLIVVLLVLNALWFGLAIRRYYIAKSIVFSIEKDWHDLARAGNSDSQKGFKKQCIDNAKNWEGNPLFINGELSAAGK